MTEVRVIIRDKELATEEVATLRLALAACISIMTAVKGGDWMKDHYLGKMREVHNLLDRTPTKGGS